VLRGHVVDFLQLPSWPVFNVADIAINTAAVLIVVLSLRGRGLDGHRVVDDDETAPPRKEPGGEHRAEEDAR
jgi:signal peptidase II